MKNYYRTLGDSDGTDFTMTLDMHKPGVIRVATHVGAITTIAHYTEEQLFALKRMINVYGMDKALNRSAFEPPEDQPETVAQNGGSAAQ